jgi:hypothetical protein
MPKVGMIASPLFALPEYELAQFDLFNSAVKGLIKAKDPLLAEIPEGDPCEMMPATQNTIPSGEAVVLEPVRIESRVGFRFDDIRNCRLDALAEQADKAAEQSLAVIMPHFFASVAKMCEAAGTATDMGGAPLTFEAYLAAFSKIELDFDVDGEPVMPRLVVHPDTARVLMKLPPWTAEQHESWNAMIADKKRDYFAKRRHRKLS